MRNYYLIKKGQANKSDKDTSINFTPADENGGHVQVIKCNRAEDSSLVKYMCTCICKHVTPPTQ